MGLVTRTTFVGLLAVLTAVTTATPLAQSSGAERAVLEQQQARFAAAMAQDTAALEQMLADELRYCHTTGAVDTKATLLDTVRTGRIRWLDMHPSGMEARVYGDVGIVAGEIRQTITVSGRENPIDLRIRTIDVYVKRDGRWQLTEFQASRMQE